MKLRILAITNMYPDGPRPWLGTFVEQGVKGLLSLGVEVKVLFFDRRKEGALVYYRMARPIEEATRTFDPHLIHVMYGGVMAHKITAPRWSKPVVVTFRGSDLLGENLSGLLRKVVSHYGVWCSWRAARQARGIVVVSRNLERALPRDVDRGKVRVIPSGIDLEQFKPMDARDCRERLGWSFDKFHVLFPANAGDPVKRPGLAQAAVRRLGELGVNAELHRLSGVPYREVPLWINASNVLILTSLHEGSPTVVKEALACNVPVVSVDVGDVRERIDGLDGCHLALPEPQDLALKLLRVWNRKEPVDVVHAVQELSTRAIAERTKGFYCDLLPPSVALDSAENSEKGDDLSGPLSVRKQGMVSNTILIGTSLQDRPVQRHFVALAHELATAGHPVGLIAHGPVDKSLPIDPRLSVLHWPSARPTRIADVLFFDRQVRRLRPCCVISNFGATAIMMTIGGLRGVPVRIFWHHTLSSQIDHDWEGSRFALRWLRLRIRLPFALATHAVANSGAAKRDLVETYAVRPSKCTVFWNSLQDPLQDSGSTPAACVPNKFVCVGRLDPSKGQDVLLRALAQVVPAHCNVNVDFIGGGAGRASCEGLTFQLGLAKHCCFLGPLPHPSVLARMGRALAVVVPSREEAFGLVNIESMAVGVPVIGSDTGGIAEIVRDGVDGFLFPPGDHCALAKRMIELIENEPRREQMAADARHRFLECFESGRAVKTQAKWIRERIRGVLNGGLEEQCNC